MSIAENLANIEHRITEAARRSGREPNEVKLVAVSKTHPTDTLREAMRCRIFGMYIRFEQSTRTQYLAVELRDFRVEPFAGFLLERG